MARYTEGLLRLVARWREPPFSVGQPRGYAVEIGGVSMHGDQPEQEIRVTNASHVMTDPWKGELQRLRLDHVGHGAGVFTVFVPHALLMGTQLFPVSVDFPCLCSMLFYSSLSAALVAAAWYLVM